MNSEDRASAHTANYGTVPTHAYSYGGAYVTDETRTVADVLSSAGSGHCNASIEALVAAEPSWSGFADWSEEYNYDAYYGDQIPDEQKMHANHISFRISRFELGNVGLLLTSPDGDVVAIEPETGHAYFRPTSILILFA